MDFFFIFQLCFDFSKKKGTPQYFCVFTSFFVLKLLK
jgi:hypothetical protein